MSDLDKDPGCLVSIILLTVGVLVLFLAIATGNGTSNHYTDDYDIDSIEVVIDSFVTDDPSQTVQRLTAEELAEMRRILGVGQNNNIRRTSGAATPADAYNEGYEEGYAQGRRDAAHGYSHGYGYDDSSSYYDYYETKYQAGYAEGYDDGYSDGESEYDDDDDDDYDDDY